MKTARIWVGAALAALLATGARAVVDRSETYTDAVPPPREVLDRLNLQLAWAYHVPMDGRRDGILSIQMSGRELLVQTRSGQVSVLDADTGRARWHTRVGIPYRTRLPLAFNSRDVYAGNNTFLYSMSRATGAVQWSHRMGGGNAAPAVADEQQIYLSSPDSRVEAFYLPRMDMPVVPERISPIYEGSPGTLGSISHLTGSLREGATEIQRGPRAVKTWSHMTHLRLGHMPLLTADMVVIPSHDGTVLAVAKRARDNGTTVQAFEFHTDGPITVPPTSFEDTAYIGSDDANLYALHAVTGKVQWRYTAGTAISRSPAATSRDVFVTADKGGMARLDRATGLPLWRIPVASGRGRARVLETNPAADFFLAANPKFAYALDRSGRLLVLDYERGNTLSVYDMRDFVFPVSNESSDRLYLAANNGLVICLHDKQYPRAYRHRKLPEEASAPILQALTQAVSEPAGKPTPLRDFLDGVRGKYGLKFQIADQSFRDAGIPEEDGRPIIPPKVDKVSLGDYLRQVLAQVNATFQVVGDTVLIIPVKK